MVSPIAFLERSNHRERAEIITALLCPDDDSTCGGQEATPQYYYNIHLKNRGVKQNLTTL